MGGFFFFFVPKPHVVTFTAVYREECCVVLPWTKATERYVSFMRQLLLFFFSYHLTCYFSFIVYHLAHAREEANKEVRSRTVLDKTTCERLHDKLIVLNLIDIYKRFRFSIHDQTSMYAARVSSTHIWR